MTAIFGRTLTAMVTPFDTEGKLDLDAAAKLAAWLVENGNEGLVLAGTTGESPTLTHVEQGELFRAVRSAVDVPIVAGTGSNDTKAAKDLTERAVKAGVDGLLVVTPYYNRPSQSALLDHFKHVAQAGSDLPVVVYDIPGRTGRKIETETLADMFNTIENVVALKDAAANPAETARLTTLVDGDFSIYSGDDSLTLPLLSIGAVGVIGVATHWVGTEMLAMIEAFQSGNVQLAQEINAKLIASYEFESMDDAPNPIPSKAMMRLLGHKVGYGRAPMHIEPEGLSATAEQLLARSNLSVTKLV